jgi:Fur family ferric uptake transcriptional regulator
MLPPPKQKPFVAALEQTGHRLTSPRRRMAELLDRRRGTFTAADLLDEAEQALPIGRATVFRALELYTELRLLERIDLPSGEHAYVVCEPEHHHHVVCRSCGKSVDVQDSGLQSVVSEIARRSGYLIDTHRLELFGLCPVCRQAA